MHDAAIVLQFVEVVVVRNLRIIIVRAVEVRRHLGILRPSAAQQHSSTAHAAMHSTQWVHDRRPRTRGARTHVG